jgi:hypothetical protein
LNEAVRKNQFLGAGMSNDEYDKSPSTQTTKSERFSSEEIALFRMELASKFWGGMRSPAGVIYIAITLLGVGWASWTIPYLNDSETSPETLGIYVIGFLITVMLDSIIAWKKSGVGGKYEEAIAGIFMVISLFLIMLSSLFAIKSFHVTPEKVRVGEWRSWSTSILFLALGVTIYMSLVLAGIDHEQLKIGSADKPIGEVRNR